MRTVVVLVLLAGVVAVAVWLYRRRQAEQRAQQEARRPREREDPFSDVHGNEGALFALKVGDLIMYHNREWWVRGSLQFDEGGFSWNEHLISDFKEQHWLSVEDDEGIEVSLFDRVPPGDVGGDAGADTVTHDDAVFKLMEQGQAAFKAEGTTGTSPTGSARYADYESSDGRLLTFEQFGQQWEVSVGRKVLPTAFEVYPVSE